jgi:hypothetical protein
MSTARSLRPSGIAVFAVAFATLAAAPGTLDELSLPARLRGTMRLVHAAPMTERRARTDGAVGQMLGIPPGSGNPSRISEGQAGVLKTDAAFVSILIRRWNTDEELGEFEQTLLAGGSTALVKQMGKRPAGELRFDTELRWPIAYATTWMTPTGQFVRFAVIGRILTWDEGLLPDASPIVNIVEISLPRGQFTGTGTLVTAAKVGFEAPGRMVMVIEAQGSMMQSIGNVEREPAGN